VSSKGTPPGALDLAKHKLRAELRDRSRKLGPISPGDSTRAQERLLASGLLDACQCVAIYRALPSEISTDLIESSLRARGVRICLPRIAGEPIVGMPINTATAVSPRESSCAHAALPDMRPGAAHADRALEFCAAEGELVRSALGFEQPHSANTPIPLAQIDAFVIPARAADLRGNRLGRGRGHYDRTLAANPSALRIALLRDDFVIASVPIGEHDERLDALCTEARFALCPPRARPSR